LHVFLALVLFASPRLAFFNPIFSIISSFFPRCRHLRTSAIRQHNTKWFVSSSRTCSG
jgi:hypothetical protein